VQANLKTCQPTPQGEEVLPMSRTLSPSTNRRYGVRRATEWEIARSTVRTKHSDEELAAVIQADLVVDHCTAEGVSIHAAKIGNRFEALEPSRQGVRARLPRRWPHE
jgi:hypothetical protein